MVIDKIIIKVIKAAYIFNTKMYFYQPLILNFIKVVTI